MSDYHSYLFYVDGILTAVVFSVDDYVGVSSYLHKAYPTSSIELRIV